MDGKSASQPNAFTNRKTADSDRALSKLESQIAELEQRVDDVLREEAGAKLKEGATGEPPTKPEQTTIWGVPFSRVTLADTLRHIDRLIAGGRPGYFITANLNYNMLTSQHRDLAEVNRNASFIVCDGMPMVWWSRWTKRPLPERVAGSELIYALSKWAAIKQYRVYFLGGAPGVAQAAADKLASRYPGLQIVGVESPPFRPLSDEEENEMIQRIRATEPDIVYVALGQPKGERWIAQHCQQIGAPVCVQIGASFDFVAGGVARAPKWLQKAGLEWAYRLCQEPGRLAGRYWRNGLFLGKTVLRESLCALIGARSTNAG